MKNKSKSLGRLPDAELVTELLILPDGQILVHNLTPAFAGLLKELNPDAEQISSRVLHPSLPSREFGRAGLPVSPATQQRRPARFKPKFRNHSTTP
jgi:hypothetical protein